MPDNPANRVVKEATTSDARSCATSPSRVRGPANQPSIVPIDVPQALFCDAAVIGASI
jgi:hypothetical protein